MPKKLTAEEKLARLRDFASKAIAPAWVKGVIDCPYGSEWHAASNGCAVCSKLDGSECVDEFLAAHDASFGETYRWKSPGMGEAINRMRAWRAAKGK